MEFDDFLKKLGELGCFQRRVYFLLCVIVLFTAFHRFTVLFILGTGNHRCRIHGVPKDSYEIQNEVHKSLINVSIPRKENENGGLEYEKCIRYMYIQNDSIDTNTSDAVVTCDSWVYDESTFVSTFAMENDLVCDKKIWISNASMAFFVGHLVAAIILGLISDRAGRKKTFCFSIGLMFVSTLLIVWAPEIYSFCVLRFFTGVATAGIAVTGFVIAMELIGPSKRSVTGSAIHIFYAFSQVTLAGIAYGIRQWKYMEVACSAPVLILCFCVWYIPESPRWLLTQGRKEEAKNIMRRIAEANKVTLTQKELNDLQNNPNPKEEKTFHLLKSRFYRTRTLVIIFNWIVINMVYFGLTLNTDNLAGNIYLNFFISGLVELPAYLLCIVLLDRTGRKNLHVFCMVVGGVACICTIFTKIYLNESLQYVTVALGMLGKMGISVSYAVIILWSSEIYPTSVRNAGMGWSSSFGRFGAILSPYIPHLCEMIDNDRFGQVLPFLIFGSASVVAGLFSLILPETMNRNLPDNIMDREKFTRKTPKKHADENGIDNQ